MSDLRTTPVTRGIHHLGFAVSDLPAARDFFIQALGHKLLGEIPDYPAAFVTDDTTMITLWGLLDPESAPQFDRRRYPGLHHAAFAVATDDLVALFDRLAVWPGVSVDVTPRPNLADEDASHFIIFIPGGPRVEFYCTPGVAGLGSAT